MLIATKALISFNLVFFYIIIIILLLVVLLLFISIRYSLYKIILSIALLK